MDDYEFDEGSDCDNWEDEQVFQDHEGDDSDEEWDDDLDDDCWDAESEAERRAEYAMECSLGFGE